MPAHQDQSSHTILPGSRPCRIHTRSTSFNILDCIEFDATHLSSPGSLISFTMEHNIETSSLYLAPDDRHNFSVFVFAIERATNISVPITVDFYISDTGEFTTVAGITSDITVPYGFLHDAGDRPTTVESQVIDCWVARSVSARALTYSMFAINWMLVICSIITTSVTFNRQGGEGDVGISLLPVTIILTIPVIRGLYVGSPPFGIHLGTCKSCGTSPQGFKVPSRHGRVLPTNADSRIVHRGNTV